MDHDTVQEMKQKSKRALNTTLSCKRVTSSCYHNVPFGRISETVTRQPHRSQPRVVEDMSKTTINCCSPVQCWTDLSSRHRGIKERNENNASHDLEKGLLGSNQKKIAVDQLPHPSRLRMNAKRKHRAAAPNNTSDVTKHIQQLKSKQLLCARNTSLVKVHSKQQNTEVPYKKYRIQVRPSDGIQSEGYHNLAKCTNITSGSVGLLDTLTVNAGGFIDKGLIGRAAFLDDVAYKQPDIQDNIMSLHTDVRDVTAGCTEASDVPENIPSGHDNSLLMKTMLSRTPLLDSIREQSFLIDFRDVINQSRFHPDPDRSAGSQLQGFGNSSFSNEPGVLWDSPLMCSTPKTEVCQSRCLWSEGVPTEADMAPQLFTTPSFRTGNGLLGCDDYQATVTDNQPLWEFNAEEFTSQDCSPRHRNPWVSPRYIAQLDNQSPEQELIHIHNSLMSSECCQSGDSLGSCQRNLYERCDGETNLLQSQVEDQKLDLWAKYGSTTLEE